MNILDMLAEHARERVKAAQSVISSSEMEVIVAA